MAYPCRKKERRLLFSAGIIQCSFELTQLERRFSVLVFAFARPQNH